MDAGNGRATCLPYSCLACTRALDQTVDWRYNIEFIRRKFRLQTLLMLEEGSHQLINERADIRAALTGLIPAFYMQSRNIFIIKV